MIIIHGMQEISTWLSSVTHISDSVSVWLSHSPINWPLLAQDIKDPDVLGQMQRAFDNFIKTGQVWALLIGLILGYMFRGFTV